MGDHMPFCINCGAEIPADKKFCVHCGEPMETDTVPPAPAAPTVPVHPSSPCRAPPAPSKRPGMLLVIGCIVAVLVIIAALYGAGLPMLKANPKSADTGVPAQTPSAAFTFEPTEEPTPLFTIAAPETPALPVPVLDPRLEEEYEPVYSLNKKFSFGEKVTFAHVLTRPPLYIRFNLTPTQITRHRLVSAMTRNEHYVNTTENNPLAWFEVRVLDAGSGAVIDQQGFGKDYPDITRHDFMVRRNGNYVIEMSGNEVTADVRMLIGTT